MLSIVSTSEFQRKTDPEKSLLLQSNLTRRYRCEFSSEEKLQLHEDELELMAEARTPLQELYPREFNRYLELFFTFMPKRPCHVKTSYQSGFICQKGKYKDKQGEYDRPCYDDMVAKMLDLHRWNLVNSTKKKDDQFWIALTKPRKTRLSRIDFDNKRNCIGYFCPGKTGEQPLRPIAMYTLEHFQAIKRIYDAFPNRIWCVSSATMGLHIWDKLPNLQTIETLHRHRYDVPESVGLGKGDVTKLAEIGLGNTELHPMTGRPCRLPFGEDYSTITPGGILLEDWVEQLAFFDSADEAPSFEDIFRALRSLLVREWHKLDQGMVIDSWTAHPYNNFRKIKKDRPHLAKYIVADYFVKTRTLRQDLLLIDHWAAQGFPTVPVTVVPVTGAVPKKKRGRHVAPAGRRADLNRTHLKIAFSPPDCGIDLSDVCNGEWVQHCQKLAAEGLPAEDSIFVVISQLARWFYFIELWDTPASRRLDDVIKLLAAYCLTKNNGRISRLAEGLEIEVVAHVERIVKCAIGETDEKGKLIFAQVRQRRASGEYRQIINLQPLLANDASPSSCLSSVGFTLCCSDLKPNRTAQQRREAATNWQFLPDDQPLPVKIEQAISGYYQDHSIRLYKPTCCKLTRFINYLWQRNGEARLSVQALKQMGFSDHLARQHIANLETCGIISQGGYCPAEGISKRFKLTKRAMELLDERAAKVKQA